MGQKPPRMAPSSWAASLDDLFPTPAHASLLRPCLCLVSQVRVANLVPGEVHAMFFMFASDTWPTFRNQKVPLRVEASVFLGTWRSGCGGHVPRPCSCPPSGPLLPRGLPTPHGRGLLLSQGRTGLDCDTGFGVLALGTLESAGRMSLWTEPARGHLVPPHGGQGKLGLKGTHPGCGQRELIMMGTGLER